MPSASSTARRAKPRGRRALGGWCSVDDERKWYKERGMVPPWDASAIVQCSGTTRNGARCKVTNLCEHPGADPLRKGAHFCAKHTPLVMPPVELSNDLDEIAREPTVQVVCDVSPQAELAELEDGELVEPDEDDIPHPWEF